MTRRRLPSAVKTQNRSNRWEDHYTRQARKENFPARSVFKLNEIQNKFRLIKKGDFVLDLGCAPGSWLLKAAELAGENGRVVGIDLKPVTIRLPGNAVVFTGDILAPDDSLLTSLGKDFNVVLSDMAPATSGNKFTDAARSFDLCRAALSLARTCLVPGGFFVCKIFQGEDFKLFSEALKKHFARQSIFKPQSSRKASREIFLIGIGKR